MTSYLIFVLKRFGQFLLVVFLGVTITFFVTHLTPIDPVEESIGAITQMGQSDPNAIELMRQSLRELYGMEGSIWQQYLNFWLRLATGDLGPSLSAFPTPVSTIILRSLPWTIGLMTVSTLITFVL
ncbi:ABC transporter permease, partial [Rhizobium leguminosarum]|nr:ABC transporter permease [Rhizobium leguminosarum]